MPERTQRYSQAERAGQAANRREAAKRAKYGTSYEQQGYRPFKEQGAAFLKRQELKAQFGAFANPTWDYEVRGGQVYRRPKPGQVGRIAEQGGTGPQWELAPDYVQRSYSNPRRQAFFAQNPELASRPGGGQDAWLYQRFVGGLQRDPATGLPTNRQGEAYLPTWQEAWAQGGRGGQYVGPQPPQAPISPFAPAPGAPQTGGGFMAPPQGYIPGYAMPWSMPSYGQPQWGRQSLGQIGGPFQAPQTPFQPPGTPRTPTYRPLQAPQPQGTPWMRAPQTSPFMTPRYQNPINSQLGVQT